MPITNGDSIDGSTIGSHAKTTILLGHKYNRNGTRASAFTYMAILDELLYLPMDLLSFFGVDAVGRRAPGMRSILCSMPRRGGRPGGSSSGKTSSNCYNKLENTRGRGLGVLFLPPHLCIGGQSG